MSATVTAHYWRATRAYSFPASVVPVLVGTALAARGYGGAPAFDAGTFLVTLLGAVLAHFGANVLNDYFDFLYGVDTRPEHGSGVLTGGLIAPRPLLLFGLALMAGAGLCGAFLLARHAQVVLPLALLGLACAVLYPAWLKRYALGDLLIIVAFGIGLTLGAYGVQVDRMTLGQFGFVTLPRSRSPCWWTPSCTPTTCATGTTTAAPASARWRPCSRPRRAGASRSSCCSAPSSWSCSASCSACCPSGAWRPCSPCPPCCAPTARAWSPSPPPGTSSSAFSTPCRSP